MRSGSATCGQRSPTGLSPNKECQGLQSCRRISPEENEPGRSCRAPSIESEPALPRPATASRQEGTQENETAVRAANPRRQDHSEVRIICRILRECRRWAGCERNDEFGADDPRAAQAQSSGATERSARICMSLSATCRALMTPNLAEALTLGKQTLPPSGGDQTPGLPRKDDRCVTRLWVLQLTRCLH